MNVVCSQFLPASLILDPLAAVYQGSRAHPEQAGRVVLPRSA